MISKLKNWGFILKKTTGSHAQYEGRKSDGIMVTVTVDEGYNDYRRDQLWDQIIKPSGLTRKQFLEGPLKTG